MGIEALSLTHPLVAASAPSPRHCLLSAHESVPPQQPVGPPPPAAPHEPVPPPPVFDISRYATLVGVLDLILQELGVESCIYLGHSVYVVIGVLISISRPDHFTKLVLLSASPSVLKTIERNRTYTKDNVSSKTVQQDIEVTTLYDHSAR